MKPIDFVLTGVIVLILAGAVMLMIRRKKTGCCSGSCSGCSGSGSGVCSNGCGCCDSKKSGVIGFGAMSHKKKEEKKEK